MTLRIGTGRPEGGYRLADGSRPLSASQVAKFLGDPEPLTRWAVLMSRAGKDPWRHRDDAADIGTAVHAAIVTYLTGEAHETLLWDAADPVAAERAFAAWERWWQAEDRGTPIAAEMPLVSERMRLAGTFDLIATRAAPFPVRPWLYDWKGCGARSELTGRWKETVFRDQHIVQAALYARLALPEFGPIAGATIVYIPRDDGDAIPVDITGDDWQQAMDDAEALVPIVRRHVERQKAYGAMARPCPALEPVDADAPIEFGP